MRQNANANGPDAGTQQTGELPPLPPGIEIKPGLTAEDAISKTLGTLPPPQLMDILSQLQALVVNQPQQADNLFRTQPQVAYATFQALLLMKLVDPSTLTNIIQQTAAMPPAAPPQPAPSQPTPQAYGGYPPAPPFAANVPTPPVQPPYQPPQAAAAPAPAIGQDKGHLIAQLMAMPQEQINLLPVEQRNQIMALRQQYAGGFPGR
jgi:cleavage stimulation factor subunit 2